MSALIVYDSIYGNTEKIARAVARAMALGDEVMLRRVGEANPIECRSYAVAPGTLACCRQRLDDSTELAEV